MLTGVRPGISVVVPMYNEEDNIEHALAVATDALSQCASSHEIIVVDDASTDRSPEIVRRLAAADPRIRVVRHERNQKLGGSLRDGFAAAGKELVLYMDADLPWDPREIGRALSAMDVTRADMIAAGKSGTADEWIMKTPKEITVEGYLFLDSHHAGATAKDFCQQSGGRGIHDATHPAKVRGLWEVHPVTDVVVGP